MNTGLKILIGLTVTCLAATGGYFLYKNLTKEEETPPSEEQFAKLVQIAHDFGSDTFKGLSTIQLNAMYNKAKASMSSNELEKLILLFKKQEKNWTKNESKEFSQLFSKLK